MCRITVEKEPSDPLIIETLSEIWVYVSISLKFLSNICLSTGIAISILKAALSIEGQH